MSLGSTITERVEYLVEKNIGRDKRHRAVKAIREGDYETVAPGIFPDGEDRALVANLVDTAARDVAEVKAPLPGFRCLPSKMSVQKDREAAEKRTDIVNAYVQASRLQDQMYAAADRHGTFGFLAYTVEPDFDEKMPLIRANDTERAYYVTDWRGRTLEYVEVADVPYGDVCLMYPEHEAVLQHYAHHNQANTLTLFKWYDKTRCALVCKEARLVLEDVEHKLSRCPVRVVEMPYITDSAKGQFDDVLGIQIARVMMQFYTLSAVEQSVNAPLVMPPDANSAEIGPLSVIQTEGNIGRVPLSIPQGVFPESQMLQMEQRIGSRYPEGRSGNIDASIITGQGVQALMGTFDTQIQTFHRLNASALEDVISLCLEMDETYFGSVEKSVRVRDKSTTRQVTYTPSKDIAGDYTCEVSYGAIAGLDPNRGLVFILQSMAAGMISKATGRKYLPVDLDTLSEERQIDVEAIREALVASMQTLPQLLPSMAAQGQDPRDVILQVVKAMELRQRGKSIEDSMKEVFAPKQKEPEQAPALPPAPGPAGAGPASPADDLLMTLAGLTPGGDANLQSSVSRREPV